MHAVSARSYEVFPLLRFYVRTVVRVFRNPALFFSFVVGCLMHGAGHAALAVAAAACARAWLISPGSVTSAPRSALAFSALGVVAILAKVGGGIFAARAQAHVAGEVGGELRVKVLEGWLQAVRTGHPRHSDHGLFVHRRDTKDPRAQHETQEDTAASTRALGALTSGVREVEQGLNGGLLGGVRAAAQLLPLLVLLVVLAPKLGGYALLALFGFGFGLSRARRALKSAHSRVAAKADALLEASDEAVRHADLWATYGAGHSIRAQVVALNHAFTAQSKRLEFFSTLVSGASELLAGLTLLGVLALVDAHVLVAPDASLVPFVVAFFMAYKPLRELGDARAAWIRAQAALDRIGPWLSLEVDQELADFSPAPRRVWPMAVLDLRCLTLSRGALSPLSLSIAPGEIVVLRGATGIGKSTLLRTLLGLESPQSGEVQYGETNLSLAPAGPIFRPFAWVPQDAPLLMGSLEDNLNLSGESSEHQENHVLDRIGASRLREELAGVRLVRDRTLSGGERQWIALGRALATEQPVLLLDEPTSGLDPASQARVLAAIGQLRGKRSVLLVTHRDEPGAIADRVLLLD